MFTRSSRDAMTAAIGGTLWSSAELRQHGTPDVLGLHSGTSGKGSPARSAGARVGPRDCGGPTQPCEEVRLIPPNSPCSLSLEPKASHCAPRHYRQGRRSLRPQEVKRSSPRAVSPPSHGVSGPMLTAGCSLGRLDTRKGPTVGSEGSGPRRRHCLRSVKRYASQAQESC